MIKTLSQDVMKIFTRPQNLQSGIWNHFSKNLVISNNISFDIYYKECLDKNRVVPIDRYYSNLNFKFGNKNYKEESFYLSNGFNKKENYYDYKLTSNGELIDFNQINPLVFKKINLFIKTEEFESFIKDTKHKIWARKLYPDEKILVCNKYYEFCETLESSIITRHIGLEAKNMIRVDKYEVPSIIKEYYQIKPIIHKWSKLTSRDILIDRLYSIYLDFLLVG